ncbi:putative flagellar protein FliO/FliZ [Magnetofaba australis IT-1]|uniref:Putative flagellar protein FliO/FliZ n=1 Tax=Magnetofaba australis IT-1 TaxID=1434232 RepID=A0A1Y2JZL9_9PROT|nr:putative flagellar protein FliO/FliZ [Magnetofaba australis IT-1]
MKPQQPPINLMEEAVRIAGYLLALIAVAALVIQINKRLQPKLGASGVIQVLASRALGPGVGVRLVQVGSRAWLLGVGKDRINLLAELSSQETEQARRTAGLKDDPSAKPPSSAA